jgi:quercetin dioxygenase-like cupin family protein
MQGDGYTILNWDDFERTGNWRLARRSLGLGAFGMNIVDVPPGEQIPEHDETARDHEEVFIVIDGSPTVVIDGEEHTVERGTFVRVAPHPRRTVRNDADRPARLLIVSAPRSSGYEPMGWA